MKLKIGIVGATGLVGKELLSILSEKHFDISDIRLFASEKSINTELLYKKTSIPVNEISIQSFDGLDYVFFCSTNEISANFVPIAVKSGAKIIDNSSHFRNNNEIPLIVPEINWDDNFHKNYIFANPNCSTIIALISLFQLHKIFNLTGFHATTFQAASGYGRDALSALTSNNIENQKTIFGCQLSLNAIPKIGELKQSMSTAEEEKMLFESRKILNNSKLKVSATCVRVPVERAHSLSILASFEKKIDIHQAKQALKSANNIIYKEDFDIPTPIAASNRDECFVGRLREDTFIENGLSMFVSCDQIRKGAALNAVQIFEKLIAVK